MKICCVGWKWATSNGSNPDDGSELIGPDQDGAFVAADSPPIRFCPWCGDRKPCPESTDSLTGNTAVQQSSTTD